MTRIVDKHILTDIQLVKKFYLNPKYYDMWAHQNRVIHTGDCIEGVLLDNFVVFTKHGIAAIYEHYVNSNQSDYEVHFIREHKHSNPGWTKPVLEEWYDFEDKNIEERR